jgi:hypothetical protein
MAAARVNFCFLRKRLRAALKSRSGRSKTGLLPRLKRELPVKLAMSSLAALALAALSGCAQMSAQNAAASADKAQAATGIVSFQIPADALGAHDPQLAAVLAKAGALAAAQKQPTTILVTALAQDFPDINQAIWKGVPPRQAGKLRLENLTAGARQPYSVSIKPTTATPTTATTQGS